MRQILLGAFTLSALLIRSRTRHDALARVNLRGGPDPVPLTGPITAAILASLLIPIVWPNPRRRKKSTHNFRSGDDKALLDAIVDSCPDIIFLKNIDGVYLSCNRAAAAFFGLSQHEIPGKTDADLFPREVSDRYRMHDEEAIFTRRGIVDEQHIPGKEPGETRTLDMLKTAVTRPDGTVMGVLGVARDVTQRRRDMQKSQEQENLLREMSSLAHMGGWEIDVAANRFSFTAELARLHEFAPERRLSLGMFLSHYDHSGRRRIEQAMAQTLETGAPHDIDSELILPSGARKWVRSHWRATMLGDEVTRIWGMEQDTTAGRKLSESMQMADLVYSTTSDAILVADRRNIAVDANPAFLKLFNYARDEVIGVAASELIAESPAIPGCDTLSRVVQDQDSWEGEMRCRLGDGRIIDVSIDIHILRAGEDNAFRRAIRITDLTEHKRKDQQLWARSNFDQLTGLPNRGLFLDRLAQALNMSRMEDDCVGLLCLDLDRFHEINDMVGHAGGDRVLVETSTRIRGCLPETATVARLAGDRFAVIVADCRAQLDITAQAVMDAMSRPFVKEVSDRPDLEDKDGMYLSASIGIAVYPDNAEGAEGLLKAAEQAMVQAKRGGGKRFQYCAPLQQAAALENMRILNDLRHAIERKELHMAFQPIVHLASGKIVKAEALLRWTHPVFGPISPAQFIPLAEQSGLIVEIGNWIIDQAIARAKHWQTESGTRIELSVNSSPVQFEQNVANIWIDRLANAGLPPGSITIEITEGMLISDFEQVRGCLKKLQKNGSKVSLDDFGTGYSALSYLKRFAFDYLKIDKSFIKNLEHDASDMALTQAIIAMAHRLGIETIAEGVETAAQRDILAGFGCDYIQGYLISQPLTHDAFDAMLSGHEADKMQR